MVEPILISPFFTDYILPFVLVFTLIFAILQKTQLLGEGKKQINAILGLIIGVILLAFPFARDIIVKLMPFLAISAVVLFVFMLIYGFMMGKQDGDVLHKGVKIALGIIFALALVTALLFISGYWDPIYDLMFNRATSAQIWINVLLIVVIGGAIAAVLSTKDKGEKE
tara:strand:+ start:1226 stop:1729 length:504 start_codon:yes stop_codon:yes gene_type:complete